MTRFLTIAAAALSVLLVPRISGATPSDVDEPWEGYSRPRVAVVAGLIQPLLLRGGNVEVDVYFKRLVVSWSHGFRLDLEGSTVVGESSRQGLSFHLPFSTGWGIGYRFLDWLDVRIESKAHRFEVRDEASGSDLFEYTTLTLGMGVYAQFRPFHDFDVGPKWLRGFVAIASVRYWPRFWSSLDRDERTFDSPTTRQTERHRASDIGIADSPWIVNVGVGYGVTF